MIKKLLLRSGLSLILQRRQSQRFFFMLNFQLFFKIVDTFKVPNFYCGYVLFYFFILCREFFTGLQNLLLGLIHLRLKWGCLTNSSFLRLIITSLSESKFIFFSFTGSIRVFTHSLKLYQNPAELDNWLADLNPESKVVIPGAYAVPSLRTAAVGDRFQFERLGKFWTLF